VKGFTLLEIMIALAIMAGVLLTVISSFNYHLSLAARDREETIATLLARAKMDGPVFSKQQDKTSGTFAPDWPEISWETTTEPAQIPGVKKLTFTVTWDDKRRSLAFVRFLAQ
jgi:general secretion pathway protein I